MPLVLVGIVLISGIIGADAYGEEPTLGVLFGILTAIAYSGFLLVLRAGNRDMRRPAGPLLDATAAAAAGSAVAGVFLGELDRTSLRTGPPTAGCCCWRLQRPGGPCREP